MLSVGLCAQIACIWEATARKPGNVHRYRDFADTSYVDFLLSAAAIGPVLEAAGRQQVGDIVLQGVRATRQVVSTNTNLGILLLLSPLAAVSRVDDFQADLTRILNELTVQDARDVYDAIRLARPAGMGRVAEQDVQDDPTQTLRQVMVLAAGRDIIARQYANGFHEVFHEGVPALQRGWEAVGCVEGAVLRCHLHLLALNPDTLIARKRGWAEAEEACRQARRVQAMNGLESSEGASALAELDAWLRAEGNSRNPGATADLTTACLFVALRQGILKPPYRFS